MGCGRMLPRMRKPRLWHACVSSSTTSRPSPLHAQSCLSWKRYVSLCVCVCVCGCVAVLCGCVAVCVLCSCGTDQPSGCFVALLLQVAGDEAEVYCVCHGMNDGSFMVGCDHCDNWYHGQCIGVTESLDDDVSLTCPPCCKAKGIAYQYQAAAAAYAERARKAAAARNDAVSVAMAATHRLAENLRSEFSHRTLTALNTLRQKRAAAIQEERDRRYEQERRRLMEMHHLQQHAARAELEARVAEEAHLAEVAQGYPHPAGATQLAPAVANMGGAAPAAAPPAAVTPHAVAPLPSPGAATPVAAPGQHVASESGERGVKRPRDVAAVDVNQPAAASVPAAPAVAVANPSAAGVPAATAAAAAAAAAAPPPVAAVGNGASGNGGAVSLTLSKEQLAQLAAMLATQNGAAALQVATPSGQGATASLMLSPQALSSVLGASASPSDAGTVPARPMKRQRQAEE